jgi:hypothetical protein
MQALDFFKCLPWAQHISTEDLQNLDRSADTRLSCILDRSSLMIYSAGHFIPLTVKPIYDANECKLKYMFSCEIWICTKATVGGLFFKVDGEYYLINHTAIEAMRIVKKRKREGSSGPRLCLSWPMIELHICAAYFDDVAKGVSSEKSVQTLSIVVEKMSLALNTERLYFPMLRRLGEETAPLNMEGLMKRAEDSLKCLLKLSSVLTLDRASRVSESVLPDSSSVVANKKTNECIASVVCSILSSNISSTDVSNLEREIYAKKKISTQIIESSLDQLFLNSEEDQKNDVINDILKTIEELKNCESSFVMTTLLPRVDVPL